MMRNIRTLMIALALFFGATTMLTAQVKVAHIDVQKLLEEMPERKSIAAQLLSKILLKKKACNTY